LFGGPLFSIFKALTQSSWRNRLRGREWSAFGFWLATEDHDLAEVNHVALLSERGLPERLAVGNRAFESNAVGDAPVGTVKFGADIQAVVERAAALLGDSEVATWLRRRIVPGKISVARLRAVCGAVCGLGSNFA